MSMRIFSGIQDFLGLHDPSTAGISSADHRFAGMPDSAGESGVGSWSSDGLAQGSIVTPMTVANEHERIGKCSHNRHVHFPPEDKIVSGYHEPKKPPLFDETRSVDIEEIQQAYRMACMTNRLFPDQNVEEQIKTFHRFGSVRQESLSLKGQRMSNDHINCLEDIFRRVQFDVVDFQYTFLDDDVWIETHTKIKPLSDGREFGRNDRILRICGQVEHLVQQRNQNARVASDLPSREEQSMFGGTEHALLSDQ
ncbi:hypothetical protein L596_027557 [Steinernema carpocapsae]|uniref:Uncharacterized protein n=1 Tax=Steinernema carpocapsae TaxID=34508 RepID=A0A4U5LVV8_STECR|nr:hypothetical protein L596_027557 [Steinernema carpocapsae]